MPEKPQSEIRAWAEIALMFALYLVCCSGPYALLLTAGPLPGAAAAVLAAVFWVRFGPPAMPGLVPGLMAMSTLAMSAMTLLLVAWRVGAALLSSR